MKSIARMLAAPTISEDEFLKINSRYPDLRLELVEGEVVAMPPAGGESGRLEGAYSGELYLWSKTHGGKAFGPSTGFRLPNGNIRSADASILLPDNPAYPKRWSGFIRGCPDFLIEVRSPSDRMARLREKMRDWIQAGCRLGWLVDPVQRRVLIYKPGGRGLYEARGNYAPVIRRAGYADRLTGDDLIAGLSICPAELDCDG